jgi:hypothetical protein
MEGELVVELALDAAGCQQCARTQFQTAEEAGRCGAARRDIGVDKRH